MYPSWYKIHPSWFVSPTDSDFIALVEEQKNCGGVKSQELKDKLEEMHLRICASMEPIYSRGGTLVNSYHYTRMMDMGLALDRWKYMELYRQAKKEITTEKITELKPENIKVVQSADIERLTKRSDLIQRIEKAKAVSQSEREELKNKYGKDIIAEIIAENERKLATI
ncbi:hypothetical protein Barb6XT_00872 [Bacteroidales bacterium Barb6XT]|nr:hypothetical protein Barb6XT_00872 [Bacteroidales bacterium Barb6XT]